MSHANYIQKKMNDPFKEIRQEAIDTIRMITSISIEDSDITEYCRDADIVFRRAIMAFYLVKKGYTTTKAGKVMGGRRHCTVINMLGYSGRTQSKDSRYEKAISQIKDHFALKENLTEAEYHLNQIEYHKARYRSLMGNTK